MRKLCNIIKFKEKDDFLKAIEYEDREGFWYTEQGVGYVGVSTEYEGFEEIGKGLYEDAKEFLVAFNVSNPKVEILFNEFYSMCSSSNTMLYINVSNEHYKYSNKKMQKDDIKSILVEGFKEMVNLVDEIKELGEDEVFVETYNDYYFF